LEEEVVVVDVVGWGSRGVVSGSELGRLHLTPGVPGRGEVWEEEVVVVDVVVGWGVATVMAFCEPFLPLRVPAAQRHPVLAPSLLLEF
jgi:hypothetical protein